MRLLVNNIESEITEFLNALDCDWSRTSFSKFAFKFLSFAHFLNTFSHHSVLFFVFSFSLLSFNSSIYSWSTISKRDTIVTNLVPRAFLRRGEDGRRKALGTRLHCYRKTTSRLNRLLLGNQRTNREPEILPN